MHRRSSISRRKSTSSVHSKHESIDPDVARQHAHRAATLAFSRAQDRSSAEMGRIAVPTNNAPTQREQPSLSQNMSNNGEQVIKRQQSVRFVGPNAVQRKHSIGSRAAQHVIERKPSTANLRPMALTTSAPVPAAYRPPSRSSSIGKGSVSKATGDSFATALAAYDEYYTREDDIASTPSSYRRIRRSKSMFSPLKAPHVFYTNGTPDSRPDTSYIGRSTIDSRTPQSQPSQIPLRAPKSMAFLRSRRSTSFREKNDEAVQMARDRFFHQTSQQRLREQPSFLFRSRTQKSDKPFRKSVRSSSATSYGIPIGSGAHPAQPKESVLRDKARKVSKTIKSKLKRVLGFGTDEPVAIPNQQVDAPETHVRRYNGDACGVEETFSDIPHPDAASLSRVASRVPSIRMNGSNEKLRSHTGSLRSLRSEHTDDKSRVTSWNSTVANTITSQGPRPLTEREQQRLSIINENGTHVSSTSFGRSRVPNQFSAYPIIHRPSKSTGNVGSVDSARVYSALMKRLDENSPKAKLAASRMGSVESFVSPKHIPARNSSIHSSKGSRTPATIRRVTAEDSNDRGRSRDVRKHDRHAVSHDLFHSTRINDDSGSNSQQWPPANLIHGSHSREEDDVFSPKVIVTNCENVPTNQQVSQEGDLSAARIYDQNITQTSYHTVPEDSGLTPQEIALRNEPNIPGRKGLRESRSTFFGGTSVTIARTASPFRRAMAEADYSSSSFTRTSSDHSSLIPNPLYIGPERTSGFTNRGANDDESQKAYSESVYSRTTSGQQPAAESAVSLLTDGLSIPEMPFPNSGNGDAVILDRVTYRPAMPHGSGHRANNSAGSVEWKQWMSSEVAKLERVKENNNPAYVNYALPTMPKHFNGGHVREKAQINDDDVEIAQRKVSAVKQPLGLVQQNIIREIAQVHDADVERVQHKVSTVKQPLSLVQHNPNIQNPPLLKPILKNRSAVSLIENIEPENLGKPPIPPAPPIPVHRPIRTMQSKSSLRSVGSMSTARAGSAPPSAIKISSMSGRNLLHKRNGSTTTLRSTKSVETPAKLIKKNGRPSNSTSNTPNPPGGLTTTSEKQFNTAPTRYGTWGIQNENMKMTDDADDIYGADGAGLMGPDMGELSEKDAQALGSKRIVELFLNSRRRRITGGSSDSSGGQVFI